MTRVAPLLAEARAEVEKDGDPETTLLMALVHVIEALGADADVEGFPGRSCDDCGARTFTRWAEDRRYVECTECCHVCAHKGSWMNEPQPLDDPTEAATAAYFRDPTT